MVINIHDNKENDMNADSWQSKETVKIMEQLRDDAGKVRTYAISRDSAREDGNDEYFGDTLLLTFSDRLPEALERIASLNPGRDLPLDDIWRQIRPGFAGEHDWDGVLGDDAMRDRIDFAVAGETSRMKIDLFLDTDKMALRLSMWATDSTASREMFVPVAELYRLTRLPDPEVAMDVSEEGSSYDGFTGPRP